MSAKVETKSTKKVVVAPKKQAPVRSANRGAATESGGGGGGRAMLQERSRRIGLRSSAGMRAHTRVHRMHAAGRRCTAAADGGATDGAAAIDSCAFAVRALIAFRPRFFPCAVVLFVSLRAGVHRCDSMLG
jgi:hypothetical protein